MRFRVLVVPIFIIANVCSVLAQNPNGLRTESATVPITLDQDRVVIDVDLALADGSVERVRGWVDGGNPDLWMSRRVAGLMGLNVNCDGQTCLAIPKSPAAALDILIGGMKISLLSDTHSSIKEIKIPGDMAALAPGMSAEINIPSSVLRNCDVLFDFLDRKFTIGLPGRLKFNGVKSKMLVNEKNGLIQIPGRIENKNYNLGLAVGSSISFLEEDLFAKFSDAHLDWPRMTGAVGPFNTGEQGGELTWKLLRLDRVQYGPLFLSDVAVVNFPKDRMARFAESVGMSTVGVLSTEALMNYRVGLDYAHSTVYFDIGRTVRYPDFDVVGLILRPEANSQFTIVGVADFEDKSSVPEVRAGDHLIAVGDIAVADSTMGQVWSLLEGSPGQDRKLTVERDGKQFTVVAKVRHFLGDVPEDDEAKGKSKKK
jgi:hypothetical protein